jgi:hypothetical protein
VEQHAVATSTTYFGKRSRSQEQNSPKYIRTCYNCHEKGHFAKDCTNSRSGLGGGMVSCRSRTSCYDKECRDPSNV